MTQDSSKYRDPDRGYREFGRWEIVAAGSAGRWVPNVNDKIIDYDQGYFRVMEVDTTTGYSVLQPWAPPLNTPGDADDLLVGVGPGYVSESYRIFLDTSVTPFQLTPDFRLHLYGSQAQYYKVFKGADISEQFGEVISSMYDTAGNFLGDTVPLELVNLNDPISNIKAPAPGFTNELMANGELVTLVVYSADGTQLSQAQLVVVNTKAVRRADASKRYVEGIRLESPFISAADPAVIEFPINVTVESLPLTAIVSFSDGSIQRQSIDGGQFQIFGLRNYIATEVGQQFPMVLNYRLAEDEISFNMVPSINKTISKDYVARTVTADGAYEIKIFGYPVWINAQQGYRMEYWMYNMDRQDYYNVTPFVELATNSRAFDPKAYGIVQNFTIAIDINKVDGRFAPYRAVQIMRVALLNSGDNQPANWEIMFKPNQIDGYGRGLAAVMQYQSVNNWRVNLGQGNNTQAQWLNQMYYSAEPLFNPENEEEAPAPTHFVLQFLHNTYEFPISSWNQNLNVNNDLGHGALLYVRWIRRTYDSDLHLATTALPVALG